MASAGWRTSVPIKEQLQSQAGGFDFYQLVKLLSHAPNAAQGEPVANTHQVKFRSDYDAAFPGKEVSSVRTTTEGVELVTPNYVLGGQLGPLPESYTDWLLDRSKAGDPVMADFLDIFNDRMNHLRYQVKAQSHQAFAYENPETSDIAQYLSSFLGLGDAQVLDRLPLPKRAVLGMAGMLANGRRSAVTLRTILKEFIQATVEVEECQGVWRTVDEEDRTHLKATSYPTLGMNACLGSQYWDQQGLINVLIGPLEYQQFYDLLPSGEWHEALVMMLRWLTNGLVEVRVTLLVPAYELEPTELHSNFGPGARLGHNTWVGDHYAEGPSPLLESTFIVKSGSDVRISEGGVR